MGTIENWIVAAFHFLQPHPAPQKTYGVWVLSSLANIGRGYVWFLLLGMVFYAVFVRNRGERLSLRAGLKFLLPSSIYGNPSFRVDVCSLPLEMGLNMLALAALTIGAAAVQGWLLLRLGHSPITIPAGGFAVALQVVVTLLAVDFARFLWHYQGHKVPFFWAFHHGHHSAEVLHPFFVRTHPVDAIIRWGYMYGGGGLLGGTLIYLLGMQASATAAAYVAAIGTFVALLQHFEHSHVRVSFGRLNRFFYSPYMHHIHHGALVKHHDKNLGLTGGLTLWDHLFGTLYLPHPQEEVPIGSSLEELGANNPHRNIVLFLLEPFQAAAASLRRIEKPRPGTLPGTLVTGVVERARLQ
jgi:sterol desaturase/sphingolipid hydroxylase (fatty acid hydroxylase superfamily)